MCIRYAAHYKAYVIAQHHLCNILLIILHKIFICLYFYKNHYSNKENIHKIFFNYFELSTAM